MVSLIRHSLSFHWKRIPVTGRICLFGIIFFNLAALWGVHTTIWGDWQEYLMMQVGVAEFGRIDVVPEAAPIAEKYLRQENPFLNLPWKYDYLGIYVNKPASVAGAYRSPVDGRYYFGHFFFYNILTVPAHYFCRLVGVSPFRAMTLTNAWLICLVLFYICFENRLQPSSRLWALILATFSPMAWYFDFKGPEVLTQASVFAATVAWLVGRHVLSAIFILPGTLQNPSAAAFFLLPFFSLIIRKEYRKLLTTLSLSLLSFAPALFYYLHFQTPNVLVRGSMNPDNITVARLAGVYLDLQQGMVVGFPFTMTAYVLLSFYLFQKRKFWFLALLPVTVLMLLPLLAQENWHPGQIRILRYAAWAGMMLQAGLIGLFQEVSPRILRTAVISLIAANAVYIAVCGYVWQHDYYYCDFNKAARWVLRHYPHLYHPDIEIFAECTFREERSFSSDSIIVYRDPEPDKIYKVAVRLPVRESFLSDTLGTYYQQHRRLKYAGKGWAYLVP